MGNSPLERTVDQALYESYSQGRATGAASIPGSSNLAQWSAVNDGATCDFCGYADLKIFDIRAVPWDPPVHWGCRCLIAYIGKGEYTPKEDWGDGPPPSAFPPGTTTTPAKPKPLTPETVFETAKDTATQIAAGFESPEAALEYIHSFNYSEGDRLLGLVYDQVGYNGLPTVVSTAEMDALSGTQLWRGVTAPSHFDTYLTGSAHWPGRGIYGQGTYASTLENTAMSYAMAGGPEAGTLFRLQLAPGARTVTSQELSHLGFQARGLVDAEFGGLIDDAMSRAFAGAATEAEHALAMAEADRLRAMMEITERLIDDAGALAAISGHDALLVPGMAQGDTYHIILNRGASIVEGTPWEW